MREGYKKTEVGIIPEDWQVKRLDELTNKITDGSHSSPIAVDNSEYKICTVANMKKNILDTIKATNISREDYDKLINNGCYAENGDVLLSKDGTIGKTMLYSQENEKIVLLSSIAILKPTKEKLRGEYLNQYLQDSSTLTRIVNTKTGSAIKRIVLRDINSLKIVVPPLKEQEKIAEILSTVDSQIDDTEKLIEKSEELKKGLIQKLLTKGIGHSEFKKTEVGEIPCSWEVRKLSEVADFRNGKAHEKNICEYSDFIVVNSKFISSDGNVKKYSDTCISPLKKYDLAMVMSDVPNGKAIAKCFLVDQNNKYTLNQRICALTTSSMNSRYLYYYLNRNKYFLKFDDGVKQTNLRKEEVLECPVLIPKLEEQEKIVYILSSVDSEIEEYENKKQKLEELKKGLMQQLLTGKIRVAK